MYGLLIAVAILFSSLLAEHIAKSQKMNIDVFWGALFWSIIFGVFGARVYHVIHLRNLYTLLSALQIWRGGLGIYGALIGGFIATILYLLYKREPILKWLDIACIVLPLGQAIGRFGNYFNRELYGSVTNLPWKIYGAYHPLFLYESVLNFLLFLFLWTLYSRIIKRPRYTHENNVDTGTTIIATYIPCEYDGCILACYLFGYSFIRFWLEYLRIDPWTIHGFNVAQLFSLVFMLISLLLFCWRKTHCLSSVR